MESNDVAILAVQQDICARFGLVPCPAPAHLKAGLAKNVREVGWPLNGLRHRPTDTTTGWFIWRGGALSQRDDFFEPS